VTFNPFQPIVPAAISSPTFFGLYHNPNYCNIYDEMVGLKGLTIPKGPSLGAKTHCSPESLQVASLG